MSWCDKLASTPTVGLIFALNHHSRDFILDALAPLLDTWVDGRNQRFTMVGQGLDAFSVQLRTEDGFHYHINQERMTVEFRHLWRVKTRSAGPPVAELTSQARPFTELLPSVAEKVVDVAGLINGNRSRVLEKIGIVSTTVVTQREAPPGALRFLEFISKPWKSELGYFDIQIMGRIKETDGYFDQCIHSFQKEEVNPDQLITIKLDWQRVFRSNNKVTTTDVLTKYVSSAQASALEYFEDVAEGGRFDEQLISNAI